MRDKILMKICLIALILGVTSFLGANRFSDSAVNYLQTNGISPYLIVIIISMLPIIELRGSIPVAILLLNLSWEEAVLLSIFGNMLPIPLILLFMDWFFRFISRNKLGKRFTEWLFKRTRHKSKQIQKYEFWGLTLFVGIPLPGTGAWTGAFAANIIGIRFWRSMLCIFLGVLLASVIVTVPSLFTNIMV